LPAAPGVEADAPASCATGSGALGADGADGVDDGVAEVERIPEVAGVAEVVGVAEVMGVAGVVGVAAVAGRAGAGAGGAGGDAPPFGRDAGEPRPAGGSESTPPSRRKPRVTHRADDRTPCGATLSSAAAAATATTIPTTAMAPTLLIGLPSISRARSVLASVSIFMYVPRGAPAAAWLDAS